jgi:hypothetical protein
MNDQAVEKYRVVAAFLVAPLIIPFVFLLPFSGDSSATTTSDGSVIVVLIIYAMYAVPIAYIAEFILGIPAWTVFRHYRVRSLPAFAGAGALMGWLVLVTIAGLSAILTGEPVTNLFNPSSNPYLPICVVGGSASAILFWAIVFYGAKS